MYGGRIEPVDPHNRGKWNAYLLVLLEEPLEKWDSLRHAAVTCHGAFFHRIPRFIASKCEIMVKHFSNMATSQSGEENWKNNNTYSCKYWVLLAWTANGRDVTIKEISKP